MSWDTHSDRANWFLNYLDKTPKDRFYLLTEKISLDISSSCAHEAWVGILKWSDAVCPHLPSAAWGFWRITSLNPSVALMSSSGIILPTTLGIIIQPGHLLFWFVYVFFGIAIHVHHQYIAGLSCPYSAGMLGPGAPDMYHRCHWSFPCHYGFLGCLLHFLKAM